LIAALLLAAALSCGAGCAKDSTSVFVTVDANATVPPILILRTTVARAADPSVRATANRSSSYAGDAADRPGPFVFPLGLSLTVDASFAGPVVVTIDGLDWDTLAVTASGSMDATIVAQQQTQASLTLAPVRGTPVDAGSD
jgi:hypothetical protein